MGHLLVHITHGPESPTRAALGLLVARAAVAEGHQVSVFLAGDAVALIRRPVLDNLMGLGTGAVGESWSGIAGKATIYLSGMSSKVRGVTEDDLADSGATFAMPDRLVQLTFEADRVLTY